jgi:hypothetical protein
VDCLSEANFKVRLWAVYLTLNFKWWQL